MKYFHINGIDVGLSPLGLGCWQLGGHGWGKVSRAEMVRAVHKAIDSGITLFDTAPIYGLGQSEAILGQTLGGKRKQVVIATKVGLVWKKDKSFTRYYDSSPQSIEREINGSLKRLNTDYIDLYQIHWPDPETPVRDTLEAMEKLVRTGKVRCIGCCNFSLPQLKEALQYSDTIKTIQLPYNLVDRKVERDLLPFCRDKGIKVLAYSPIARGLLSGKYDEDTEFPEDDHRRRSEDEYFQGEALLKNLEIVKKVGLIAQRLNKTPAQIALRWVLESPYITAVIFGAKSVAQVEENVAASDFTLSEADMRLLSEREA